MDTTIERQISSDVQNEDTNDLKSMKDIESFEDLDKVDLVKGETPPDIKDTCLQLCQDYLSGIWIEQTVDTIEVKRVSGGLTNQLYYCGLIDKSESERSVPQEVAIRLYGRKYIDTCDYESNERMSDVVIGLMVSENNLGPKIYGIHEKGQIQKWYKHKLFRDELQNDNKIVEQVFRSLARIHTMCVPIKRNHNWMLDSMDKFLGEAYEKFAVKEDMKAYNCETLQNNDLRTELNWINGIVIRANSPVVFTHNDFRSNNLMVTEPNNELVVCDFEYGGYGYRGFDFASMMREWGRNPFDFKTLGEDLPPKDSIFKPLIETYVEECVRIKGKRFSNNEINSVEHILNEVKVHLLNHILFFAIYFLRNDENNKDEFPISRKAAMGFSESCFRGYFQMKKKMIQNKIIQSDNYDM